MFRVREPNKHKDVRVAIVENEKVESVSDKTTGSLMFSQDDVSFNKSVYKVINEYVELDWIITNSNVLLNKEIYFI